MHLEQDDQTLQRALVNIATSWVGAKLIIKEKLLLQLSP